MSIAPCFFFSKYLRVQGALAFECLFVFLAFPLCLSMGAPCLSNQPQFLCERAFFLPMQCTEIPSLALGDAPPPYSLILVANTPLFPPNGNTWGVLPTSSVWLGKLHSVWRWESTQRHPLASPILCIYIPLFSSHISVWGTVLTLMFEWMGVFNPALSTGV